MTRSWCVLRPEFLQRRFDVTDPERLGDQLAVRVRGRNDVAPARGEGEGNIFGGKGVGDRPALFVAKVDVDERPCQRLGSDERQRFLVARRLCGFGQVGRSEGHTSELQSLMRITYAVFCLKKTK